MIVVLQYVQDFHKLAIPDANVQALFTGLLSARSHIVLAPGQFAFEISRATNPRVEIHYKYLVALALVAGSLVLVPVFLMVHPPYSEIARDMFIPQLPKEGKLSEVMLLVIAIDT
jgi:hypothetical protein